MHEDMMDRTLGSLLTEPAIAAIAPCAIKAMDLPRQPQWGMTLRQLQEAHCGGNLARGLRRLFRAAEAGDWYWPLYSEAECAGDP